MTSELIQGIRQSLQALSVQQQSLEAEAGAIVSELTTRPAPNVEPMGVDTPLVDSEGYPRGDIDLYRARTLRGRLACIQTDHKAVMKEMERHLHQLAALEKPEKSDLEKKEYAARITPKPKPKYDPVSGKWVLRNWDGSVAGIQGGENRSFDKLTGEPESKSNSNETSTVAEAARNNNDEQVRRLDQERSGPEQGSDEGRTSVATEAVPHRSDPNLRPFARVNSVATDSPAEQAGLLVGDLIVSFGNIDINSATNDPLQDVGKLVPTVAGSQQSVTVVVQRREGHGISENDNGELQERSFQLSPRPWGGRGLLGCHIVPHSG